MTDDLSLSGHTALVTGSGRNIGRAIILELARRQANVIINTRSNSDEAEQVAREAEEVGGNSHYVLGDVSDPEAVARIGEEARSAFGSVDILVSNAARRLYRSFEETTNDEWDLHLNMQLTASWYLAKEFAADMKTNGWGRIIHINGTDGWFGGKDRIPHSTAKGGLRTLTKSLAAALGPHGITVNDVVPGFTNTKRDPTTHPQVDSEFTRKMVSQTPIERQVTPEEIAWACAFLCSERSGGIAGAAIHVDGGQFMIG